jgi:translation initiation factor 1 (eIF-1/SUI1)
MVKSNLTTTASLRQDMNRHKLFIIEFYRVFRKGCQRAAKDIRQRPSEGTLVKPIAINLNIQSDNRLKVAEFKPGYSSLITVKQ